MQILATVACVLILLALGLGVYGVIYMIRLGVQFALGDMIVAFLIAGFPPAVGSVVAQSLAETHQNDQLVAAWISTVALALLVFAYQVYGFYWASIQPAPTRKGQHWQRFGPSAILAAAGSLALLWMSA